MAEAQHLRHKDQLSPSARAGADMVHEKIQASYRQLGVASFEELEQKIDADEIPFEQTTIAQAYIAQLERILRTGVYQEAIVRIPSTSSHSWKVTANGDIVCTDFGKMQDDHTVYRNEQIVFQGVVDTDYATATDTFVVGWTSKASMDREDPKTLFKNDQSVFFGGDIYLTRGQASYFAFQNISTTVDGKNALQQRNVYRDGTLLYRDTSPQDRRVTVAHDCLFIIEDKEGATKPDLHPRNIQISVIRPGQTTPEPVFNGKAFSLQDLEYKASQSGSLYVEQNVFTPHAPSQRRIIRVDPDGKQETIFDQECSGNSMLNWHFSDAEETEIQVQVKTAMTGDDKIYHNNRCVHERKSYDGWLIVATSEGVCFAQQTSGNSPHEEEIMYKDGVEIFRGKKDYNFYSHGSAYIVKGAENPNPAQAAQYHPNMRHQSVQKDAEIVYTGFGSVKSILPNGDVLLEQRLADQSTRIMVINPTDRSQRVVYEGSSSDYKVAGTDVYVKTEEDAESVFLKIALDG